MTTWIAVAILAAAWSIGARQAWREAGRIIRDEQIVTRALHAHDEDIDQLTQAAGLTDDEFVTEFRKWQARQ